MVSGRVGPVRYVQRFSAGGKTKPVSVRSRGQTPQKTSLSGSGLPLSREMAVSNGPTLSRQGGYRSAILRQPANHIGDMIRSRVDPAYGARRTSW